MSIPRIRKILKNRIPVIHNERYLKFIREKTGLTPHHYTRSFSKKVKHCDFLVYPVTLHQHDKIHFEGIEDDEMAVLGIIESLISYIEYLENKEY